QEPRTARLAAVGRSRSSRPPVERARTSAASPKSAARRKRDANPDPRPGTSWRGDGVVNAMPDIGRDATRPIRSLGRRMPVAFLLLAWPTAPARGEDPRRLPGERVPTVAIARGELSVLFRDNADSPRILSGADSLFNVAHTPGFDAFDPDSKGAGA